jgi:hypothetical protein
MGALFIILAAGFTLAAQQTTSLVLSGHQESAKVVQVQGHNYVELEGLARITNGTISFKGSQIILSLPGGAAPASAPTATPGFSKDFLTAGIEAMARVREWHSALRTAIERSVPLGTGWLDAYQEQAQQGLTVASAAINTDSDKNAYPILVGEFNNMKSLNDKYVGMTKNLDYINPNSLQSDPLDQKMVACGRSLSAMASAKQFIDDGTCR